MREWLEELILNYPVCEYAFGNTGSLVFSDKVYFICETDCKRYGHCWACPPNAGRIEDNIAKCNAYKDMLIYSTVWEVSDAGSAQACMEAKSSNEEIARQLNSKIREHTKNYLFLSTGCSICEKCACPDEPCRHPDDRLMSMESHGIVIMQVVDNLGLTFFYDSTTAVFFNMVLF